jgi:hypothetical protein
MACSGGFGQGEAKKVILEIEKIQGFFCKTYNAM